MYITITGEEGDMKHRLSFGCVGLLAHNIVEITVDEGVEVSLEMLDEYQQFLEKHVVKDFAMLINQINNYTYSFEAQLSVGSYEKLAAIAFVYFNDKSKLVSEKLSARRKHDNWNFRLFSGLELGWQQAHSWLQKEMSGYAEQVLTGHADE